MRQPVVNDIVSGARRAAASAGLVHVSDERPGIRRRRAGRGFVFVTPEGRPLKDATTLARIRALAVPPAWTDVWICPRPDGHIQATGRDARGRKQYRYHASFREVREGNKYERMLAFAARLPAIRARVRRHLKMRGLPRHKVLATVVMLLESSLIRVGNEDYARANGSYGLTTLKNRHVAVKGPELRFSFRAKSGRLWKLDLRDRRIARVIRACQELPGQDLFQYVDDAGEIRDVTSSDVNAYLREIAGDAITAKDFRTWHGTVLAATALAATAPGSGKTAAKRAIRDAIIAVAARLGNTPTICRKCYVHPEVVDAFTEGALRLDLRDDANGTRRVRPASLQPAERAVIDLLRRRLSRRRR